MVETTSLGAAMAAGAAVGLWNVDEKIEMNARKFKPKIGNDERELRFKKWEMAIERSLRWDHS